MKKVVSGVAVLSVLAAIACSSSSSKGTGGAFPYSGPSCPNGQPGNTAGVTAACISCIEGMCTTASQTTCINSTCSSYYTCFCKCAAGDKTCQTGCTQSSDCTTCEATIGECYAQAATGMCSGQCIPDTGTTGSSSSSGD